MSCSLLPIVLLACLGAFAGCAANGDPPVESTAPHGASLSGAAQAQAPAGASIEARDVAVLVLEQTPSSLHVTSSARRPRSSFGPSAAWNGAGAPTHRWQLKSARGEVLASGDIVARGGVVEAPPDPAQGAPAAHIELATFSFTAKVPQPAAGEVIEISAARADLSVRWP